MLADEVEAQLLRDDKVVSQSVVGRRRVEPVGPEPLIERTDQEDGLAVQHDARFLVCPLRNADRAQREVAPDPIQLLATCALYDRALRKIHQANVDVVQERRVGRPEADITLRNGNRKWLSRSAAGRSHGARRESSGVVCNKNLHHHSAARGRADDVGFDGHFSARNVGHGPHIFHVSLRDRFQPNRLPDSRAGRVPDPRRMIVLLAARLGPRIGGIPNGDDQLVCLSGGKGIGHVERKGRITAAMRADCAAVDRHGRFPVDGFKMKQDALAAPGLRDRNCAVIPQPLVRSDALHHSRERRLNGERHQDGPVETAGVRIAPRPDRIIPEPVEILPRAPLHLRPRVFGVRLFGRDFLGPARRQRTGGRFPISSGGGHATKGERYQCEKWSQDARQLRRLGCRAVSDRWGQHGSARGSL